VPHIATGDMLRAAIADRSPLGLEVEAILQRGDLVPDSTMVSLIRERVAEPDTEPGFVLDGFPRTLPQAESLDAMMREIGRAFTIVLALQVPDAVARERMLKRAEQEGRTDDTPEAIDRRLALYHRETEPLLEHYRTRGRFVPIHGDRPVDAVYAEIDEAIRTATLNDHDHS
jgi:adenylate kinase